MAADMKAAIAEAVVRLLTERNVRKLTVKDIVEECHITRQTFYYHFEDIPQLFRWMLEQELQLLAGRAESGEDPKAALRSFFLMAINSMPYVKKGLESNYGGELEELLTQYFYRFFELVIEKRNLYKSRTRAEVRLILRYHCQAILGLFASWTDEDTKNLDAIVDTVYELLTEGISPLE